jgi:hypothetical protein
VLLAQTLVAYEIFRWRGIDCRTFQLTKFRLAKGRLRADRTISVILYKLAFQQLFSQWVRIGASAIF